MEYFVEALRGIPMTRRIHMNHVLQITEDVEPKEYSFEGSH